jgi:hypothetical protein
MVSLVLKKYDIDRSDRKIIEKAVKDHPLSFPLARLNRDSQICSKILQDADAWICFKERIKTYVKEADKS